MKILVIGSNGREHALAKKYEESKKTDVVFIAPGNGLTDFASEKIKNVDIAMTDIEKLVAFAKKEKIDLVDVAQDDCLAAGYVDRFQKEKINVFGPTKKAAAIEWSKEWARNFMTKYKLPIPSFHTFHNTKDAIAFIKKGKEQTFFIKASGLALGKGVIKATTKQEAVDAIHQMQRFGKSGKTFLIEEALFGEEFSLFAICDGKNYVITKAAQDHKTIYEGNSGPNTGGIGSVAPTNAVTQKMLQRIETTIIKPVLSSMEKEGRPYSGILYLGGMITHSTSSGKNPSVKVIEFNARWGDPEAEVILPSLTTDYVDVALAVREKKIKSTKITFDNKIRLVVTGCATGYPIDYTNAKGKEIFGLAAAMKLPGITIFGSGIKRIKNNFYVNGGRVFHLVAEGETIIQARVRAYGAMSMIHVKGDNLHYRNDIGWKDVERFYL